MKYNITLLFIIFSVSCLFAQNETVQLNVSLTEKIDDKIKILVDKHFKVLSERHLVYDSSMITIVFIYPVLDRADGVPDVVIDSLYSNNNFSRINPFASYKAVVYSIPKCSRHIEGIVNSKDSIYGFQHDGMIILLVSDLNLTFTKIQSFDLNLTCSLPFNEDVDERYWTFYTLRNETIIHSVHEKIYDKQEE